MRLGTAALTLTVALTFAGLASAQESGNWFTRWLSRPSDAKIDDGKHEAANVAKSVAAARVQQAKADLERRRDVCLKLREIAIANGDEDLQRKSEMLDQRAYELFLAAKNQAGISRVEVQKGAR